MVKITQISFKSESGTLKIPCEFMIFADDIKDFRKLLKLYYQNEKIYFNYTENINEKQV